MHPRHLLNRQAPAAPTTLPGFTDGPATANTAAVAGATSLQVDGSALGASPPAVVPTLVPGSSLVITDAASSTSSPNDPISPTAAADTSASTKDPIALGTVVGACVGALAVLFIVIVIFFWFRSRETKRKPRYPAANALNSRANAARRKSAREVWDQLPEDSPKGGNWEGMRQSPSAFKSFADEKSPRQNDPFTFPPKKPDDAFDKYHPQLAEELSQPPRLVVRDQEPFSWGGETMRDSSFLSLKTASRIPSALSPIPSSTSLLQQNQWDPPSTDDHIHNPFADAHDVAHLHHNSDDSTHSSQGMVHAEREREMRAMQSLIAALDAGGALPGDKADEEAERRLRAQSQLSATTYSRYSTPMGGEYEDDASSFVSFPLPPDSKGKGVQR